MNLFEIAQRLDDLVRKASETFSDPARVVDVYLEAAESSLARDLQDNQDIGRFGADYIASTVKSGAKVKVLTHCNTGSLATAGWVCLFTYCLNQPGNRIRNYSRFKSKTNLGSCLLHRNETLQSRRAIDSLRTRLRVHSFHAHLRQHGICTFEKWHYFRDYRWR